MLLRIATTHRPATDLGFLLHKHPERAQSFDLAFGKAHVFYPEATAERCEFAMLLDVDPVGLARGSRNRPRGGADLTQYVNDRPYATSSFMSVAIARVLGTALGGKSTERPELADTPIPLKASLSALPSRKGPTLIEELFEPLGYEVETERLPLDPSFPDWGDSRFHTVSLSGVQPVSTLLRHLYVLIPVLDDYKHYWIGPDEIEKLLDKGEGWLGRHPMKETIARRYLRHRRSFTTEAMLRLVAEDTPDLELADEEKDEIEIETPSGIRLHELRLEAVLSVLRVEGSGSVVDLGCGEGRLVSKLLKQKWLTRVLGVDVSTRALDRADKRLRLHELPPPVRARVELIQGSVLYRDERLLGFDAIAAVEVVEHLDTARLKAFFDVVFRYTRPRTVVVTTPNREYNSLFPTLPAGRLRHPDHRFEWSRDEFRAWASQAEAEGYSWVYHPLGEEHPEYGAPSQMGVFTRDG